MLVVVTVLSLMSLYLQIMSSYLQEDENYVGFANQLSSIGLRLKDIPGDG